MSKTYERVHFRFIVMPCCQHQFCNVNPRLPSYCPACGASVYPQVKGCVLISDENASLKYDQGALQPGASPTPG